MAVLNVFKLVFKVDNSFGLMVEGGGGAGVMEHVARKRERLAMAAWA
jgi:predicted Rossmann-fold nucleotide-binding protein